jgi:hypothetical protein
MPVCQKEQTMVEKEKNGEYGAVLIVEAVFVFPIMFIIVFVMLMAGSAFFQHARVERLVVEAALDGASRCENPMLEKVSSTGSVPKEITADTKVMPYRYLLTQNAKKIGAEIGGELEQKVRGLQSVGFSGLEPKNVSVRATPHMFILVSSFQVECEFDIELPIRMLFAKENFRFHYAVSMTEPIGDPAEFVRNVSLVQDLLERNETVMEIAGKFQKAMQKLAKYLN